ncbi:MAG TPA: SDR family NAD(P)-dependent oxidoreductase [Chitinophagaceae bacterium]|nr:SDR family NAD(P)-dependent oxidoreductase [Chitinophagaceae bacterium]
MKPLSIPDYDDNNRQSLPERMLFPVRSVNKKKLAEEVTGKTILITGASYGIGALLATILSNYKVTLVLIARTAERLEQLKNDFAYKACTAHIVTTDLRDELQIIKLLQNLSSLQLKIDIFINNAGKSIYRGLEASLDRFHDTKRCAATNYTGPVQLLLGILPGIKEKKGHIINVSALNVLLPPTFGWSAYQSSKAAFDQWLRCMEPELRYGGIYVSTAYLPLVRTRMSMVNENKHQQPAMSKVKAVNSILRLIINKKRKYKPWWLGLPVLLNTLIPGWWYQIQLRNLKKRDSHAIH